jgi:hypothetical protein
MWETNFWARMLDEMARHRYNLLSLWNLHPFPSMVRVSEYPNVALADVKRKAGAMWDANLLGQNMYDASWELTTIKKMTIEEKIAFWRWVMQYAAQWSSQYVKQVLTRMGLTPMDIAAIQAQADADIPPKTISRNP